MSHEPATIEGGDITVIGNRRSDDRHGRALHRQGIETLARSLFAAGSADTVIAVELPRERAFMHLDTAMTMVDRDAFSVYPYLPAGAALVHPHAPRTAAATSRCEENDDLFPEVAEVLGVDKLRVLRTPSTRWARNASSGTTATTSWPSRRE